METPVLSTPPHVSYGELVRLFLRLSLIAFGGPVAHIALGEQEIVVRRKWLTREHYLDLIAATNLIPGPNSTEVMIHVGYTLRGIPGAILTGICFIGPTFLLTLLLSVIYVSSGSIPQVNALLWGIKPVMVAIIANVAYRLILTALKTPVLWVVFALSIVAMALLDMPEVLVMLGAGAVYALYEFGRGHAMLPVIVAVAMNFKPAIGFALGTAQVGLGDLFLYFLKIGSVLFGSGYVLIAYIQQDLVNTFGWLTSRQLLDAIAIGQVTPGPVSTAVTVIGYILAGVPGAVVATLGIFLPAFVLVILTAPLIPRLRNSPITGAFLTGVNAGVVAAILLTLFDLTRAALLTPDGAAFSPVAIAVSLISLALLMRTRINATWLIAAGGIIGLVVGS
jgi:chromate transporter